MADTLVYSAQKTSKPPLDMRFEQPTLVVPSNVLTSAVAAAVVANNNNNNNNSNIDDDSASSGNNSSNNSGSNSDNESGVISSADSNGSAALTSANDGSPTTLINSDTMANGGMKAFVAPTPGKGQGVFAATRLIAGEVILKYSGVPLSQAEIRTINHDHFVQIDDDLYLGPSGLPDDYVNHSCDPNTALIHTTNEHLLVALQSIASGEELTFDYSMHMTDEEPIGPCCCGTRKCRGMIDIYQKLPASLQAEYESAGLAPGFAVRARQRAEALS